MQFVRHEPLFRLLFLIYKMLPVYICHSGRFLQQIPVIAVTPIFAHLYWVTSNYWIICNYADFFSLLLARASAFCLPPTSI